MLPGRCRRMLRARARACYGQGPMSAEQSIKERVGPLREEILDLIQQAEGAALQKVQGPAGRGSAGAQAVPKQAITSTHRRPRRPRRRPGLRTAPPRTPPRSRRGISKDGATSTAAGTGNGAPAATEREGSRPGGGSGPWSGPPPGRSRSAPACPTARSTSSSRRWSPPGRVARTETARGIEYSLVSSEASAPR